MQAPPPDTLLTNKYTWLGWLIAGLLGWIGKDNLSTIIDKVLGRRKASADADSQRQQNVISAADWMEDTFNKLSLANMHRIQLEREVKELKDTCKENDERVNTLIQSERAKDQWIGMLEDRLRGAKMELPRRPPSSGR